MSLSPLPLTGTTAEAMAAWRSEGIRQDRDGALARIFRDTHRAEAVLAAEGDACERRCCVEDGAHGNTA